MKRNVSVVRFKFRCNILISGKIIKEMPGSVASGTPCTSTYYKFRVNPNRNNIKKLLPPEDVYSTVTFNTKTRHAVLSFLYVFIVCKKNF